MPYIPKQHEKYNLLPMCRKIGGEVFEYPSAFLSKLEDIGITCLEPYGYKSYEEYYAELDRRKQFIDDTAKLELLNKYIKCVMELNIKENWSVLRYIGKNTDSLFGLTNGNYYYWPCSKENAHYKGVIDNEEFTAYQYPTDAVLWQIAEDPTGMACRTIFEGKDAVTQKAYESFLYNLNRSRD